MNSAIMDQACLVRGQQLSMGLETRKLELKEDDDKISDFPLFDDTPAYLCEVQVDLDHGDITYVGQEVELKGHMVYVAGQRDKYPPIRKKVPISAQNYCEILTLHFRFLLLQLMVFPATRTRRHPSHTCPMLTCVPNVGVQVEQGGRCRVFWHPSRKNQHSSVGLWRVPEV